MKHTRYFCLRAIHQELHRSQFWLPRPAQRTSIADRMMAPPLLYTEFVRLANQYRERPAIISQQITLSYGTLLEESQKLAAHMQAHGLADGAPVLLISENSARWAVASLAIQACGAVECPRETTLTASACADYCARLGSRHIVLQNSTLLPLLAEIPEHKLDAIYLLADTPTNDAEGPDLFSVPQLVQTQGVLANQQTKGEDPHKISAIIRTSGTTGEPKFVPLSHANFLHGMRTIPERLALRTGDRFLSCLPPWHLFARM